MCSQLPDSVWTRILGSGVFCHVLSLFTRLWNAYLGIHVQWNWESKLRRNLYHCQLVFYLLLWYVFISAIILVCSFLILIAYIMPVSLSTGYFHQLMFNDSGKTRSFFPHFGVWSMRCKVCRKPVKWNMHILDNCVYSQSKLFVLQ
jgi:hypothetical protein